MKTDPRQSHLAVAVRLKNRDVRTVSKIFGAQVRENDIAFFEDTIWWWRRLGKLLASNTPFELSEKKLAKFLPKSASDDLKFAFLTGAMPELAHFWFRDELTARVDRFEICYPAFIREGHFAPQMKENPDWLTWRKLQVSIDLGKYRKDALEDVAKEFDARRNQLSKNKFTALRKEQAFDPDGFRACEFIDVDKFGLEEKWRHPDGIQFNKSVIRRALRAEFQTTRT